MDKPTLRYESVSGELPKAIVQLLMNTTQGPSQAFATLAVALLKLYEVNCHMTNETPDIEKLIEEIGGALRSIKPEGLH